MQQVRTAGRGSLPRLDNVVGGYAAIIAIAFFGAALILHAYWPGIMIDDARWQYQQALDNSYENWHPPIMAWIWRKLSSVTPGPAPMLVLQVLLYWTGLALIGSAIARRGQALAGLALVCIGFLPATLALTGTVTKDALMTGAMLVATGLLLWRPLLSGRKARAAAALLAIAALLLAAALRFNAVFACVPLALVALPYRLTRTKPRLLLSAVAAAGAFLLIGSAIAALLQAEDMDVQLSLVIFDLGGITEHSGQSQFPDLHVTDPVRVNHLCYDPQGWDSYSDWAQRPCPLGFDAIQQRVDAGDVEPLHLWIRAIASHPLAYLEHRWAHFNLSTFFIVPHGPEFTAWSQSVPNPWGFRVSENRLLKGITDLADATARTPAGWPIFWISVALAALVAGLAAGASTEAIAIAASAFFYGAGYFVVGVATGMRYHMWTISGAAIGAVLVAMELWSGPRDHRASRLALPCAILLLPLLIATCARLGLI